MGFYKIVNFTRFLRYLHFLALKNRPIQAHIRRFDPFKVLGQGGKKTTLKTAYFCPLNIYLIKSHYLLTLLKNLLFWGYV